MNLLKAHGYAPQIDDDGDIIFKYEGGIATFCIIIDVIDEEFFRMVCPNFWSIESDSERKKVMQAAVYVTKKVKCAKIFPTDDDTWASVELLCSPPKGIKAVFERALDALVVSIDLFYQKMNEKEDCEENVTVN